MPPLAHLTKSLITVNVFGFFDRIEPQQRTFEWRLRLSHFTNFASTPL